MMIPPAVFASASTLANSGVGLGPGSSSFESYGDPSTLTMTALMFLGRLEILPVIVLLRRSYWRL